MPPQIDQRPYARNKSANGLVESPPPKSVISDQEILRRGCPGAPKKEAVPEKRKRYRSTGFAVIDDHDDDPGRDDDDDPKPLFPRMIFPVDVEGLPRPTPRRLKPGGRPPYMPLSPAKDTKAGAP